MKLNIIINPTDDFWDAFDKLSDESFKHNIQFKSAWLKPYINHLCKGELYIIAVYKENQLVGCLPLQQTEQKAIRYWKYRVLSILGAGPTDFLEILAADAYQDEVLQLIMEHLKNYNQWDYLNLSYLPEDSQTIKAIENAFSTDAYTLTRLENSGFCYEKTEGDWETYQAEVFNKKNKDLSKGERRIINDGIEYEIVTYTSNVFENFIKTVDLYAARRETLGQVNKYEEPHYRKFLEEVCSNYEQFGGVVFSVLRELNGENIAIQLDFVNKGIRYHWNTAFNEDYKRYSPGKILLKSILKDCFENPSITSCNHMRGLSSYKTAFTSFEENLISFKIEHLNSPRVKATRLASKALKLLK